MSGRNLQATEADKHQWFIRPARLLFAFLVKDFGFEELPAGPIRFPELSLDFRKKALVVRPYVDGSQIGVRILHTDDAGNPTMVNSKLLAMLERLRCPNERLRPEERDTTAGAVVESVLAHDAVVLRQHFPDVLAGLSQYLSSESLPSDWMHT